MGPAGLAPTAKSGPLTATSDHLEAVTDRVIQDGDQWIRPLEGEVVVQVRMDYACNHPGGGTRPRLRIPTDFETSAPVTGIIGASVTIKITGARRSSKVITGH